jgi:hypothetical protein
MIVALDAKRSRRGTGIYRGGGMWDGFETTIPAIVVTSNGATNGRACVMTSVRRAAHGTWLLSKAMI